MHACIRRMIIAPCFVCFVHIFLVFFSFGDVTRVCGHQTKLSWRSPLPVSSHFTESDIWAVAGAVSASASAVTDADGVSAASLSLAPTTAHTQRLRSRPIPCDSAAGAAAVVGSAPSQHWWKGSGGSGRLSIRELFSSRVLKWEEERQQSSSSPGPAAGLGLGLGLGATGSSEHSEYHSSFITDQPAAHFWRCYQDHFGPLFLSSAASPAFPSHSAMTQADSLLDSDTGRLVEDILVRDSIFVLQVRCGVGGKITFLFFAAVPFVANFAVACAYSSGHPFCFFPLLRPNWRVRVASLGLLCV